MWFSLFVFLSPIEQTRDEQGSLSPGEIGVRSEELVPSSSGSLRENGVEEAVRMRRVHLHTGLITNICCLSFFKLSLRTYNHISTQHQIDQNPRASHRGRTSQATHHNAHEASLEYRTANAV